MSTYISADNYTTYLYKSDPVDYAFYPSGLVWCPNNYGIDNSRAWTIFVPLVAGKYTFTLINSTEQNYDWFILRVNSTEVGRWSGSTYENFSYDLEAYSTFELEYVKDVSSSSDPERVQIIMEYDPASDPWTYQELGPYTSSTSFSWNLSKSNCALIKMIAPITNQAIVTTTGSCDTYGYYGSQNTGYDTSTGIPSYYNLYDDSSGEGGNNFKLAPYIMKDAEVYFWVKGKDDSVSGTIGIDITVPIGEFTYNGKGTYTSRSSSYSGAVKKNDSWVITLQPPVSGTMTVYTTNTKDLYGYWGLYSAGYDAPSGVPASYMDEDDDSAPTYGGSSSGFGFQFEVTAGTKYYIWARPNSLYTEDDSSVTLYWNVVEPTPDFSLSTGRTTNSITVIPNSYVNIPAGRTGKVFYKKSTSSSWIQYTSWTVASGETGKSITIPNLLCNKQYDVKVSFYNGSTEVATKSTSTTTVAFAWTTPMSTGATCNAVTAAEWNSYTAALVLKVKDYDGSTFSPTTAVTGQPALASYFNEVATQLNKIFGSGTVSTKSNGSPFMVSDFTLLATKINS